MPPTVLWAAFLSLQRIAEFFQVLPGLTGKTVIFRLVDSALQTVQMDQAHIGVEFFQPSEGLLGAHRHQLLTGADAHAGQLPRRDSS